MTRSLRAALALSLIASASVHAGLRLFDDGTQTKQVLADGPNVYMLKETGQVWRFREGRFEQIDDGTGTRMLTADQGWLFLLKDTGRIFGYDQSRWTQIDDGAGTRQISASGSRLYVLKDNGNIWRFRQGQWAKIDDGIGTRKIHAAGDKLWVLKENEHTWRYDDSTGQFLQLSSGNPAPTLDIVGDARDAFVLKGNGKLFRWRDGKFASIGWKDGHRALAVDEDSINVLNDRGTVFRWDRRFGNWTEIPIERGSKGIAAQNGTVFILSPAGQVFTWDSGPGAPMSSGTFQQLHAE